MGTPDRSSCASSIGKESLPDSNHLTHMRPQLFYEDPGKQHFYVVAMREESTSNSIRLDCCHYNRHDSIIATSS